MKGIGKVIKWGEFKMCRLVKHLAPKCVSSLLCFLTTALPQKVLHTVSEYIIIISSSSVTH